MSYNGISKLIYNYINIETTKIFYIAEYDNINITIKKIYEDCYKKMIEYLDEQNSYKNERQVVYEEYKVNHKSLSFTSSEFIERIPKLIINDCPYSVSKYINNHSKLKISNATIKLHEILNTFKNEFKIHLLEENLYCYHMAEAPGQWIRCFYNYLDMISFKHKYEWYANSLNPNNKKNIERFGADIFADIYNLIKNNKDKWIYGKDDTGDITIPENILEFKSVIHNKFNKLHFITSDAGMNTYNNTLSVLQGLDYAQMVNSVIISKKGTSVIIKMFSPFINNFKDSLKKESVNLFISILYVYFINFKKLFLYKPMTSGVTTGEFYLIAVDYIDKLDAKLQEDLLKYLNNGSFKINTAIYNINDIPLYFTSQVCNFINNLLHYNTEHIKYELDIIKYYNNLSKSISNNKENNKNINEEAKKTYDTFNKLKTKKILFWIEHYNYIIS